jgi:putative acetyltransferase
MTVAVETFAPKYRADFARLNYAWIEKLFAVEPADRRILEDPESEIVRQGGEVFFALHNGRVVGTVALKVEDETTFELTKMAVGETQRGRGFGKMLLHAAIEHARRKGAKRLVLSSHTSLTTALAMYRAAGFVERADHCSCYSRCNIFMEMHL